jgi:hypothetical protein
MIFELCHDLLVVRLGNVARAAQVLSKVRYHHELDVPQVFMPTKQQMCGL